MEDDKFKIHLLIDNERYPLTILRKDEQLYRSFENISMKDRNDTLPYTEKIRQLTEDVENCIHPQTDE